MKINYSIDRFVIDIIIMGVVILGAWGVSLMLR